MIFVNKILYRLRVIYCNIRSLLPALTMNVSSKFCPKNMRHLGFLNQENSIQMNKNFAYILLSTTSNLILTFICLLNHNSRIYNLKKVIIFVQNLGIPATVELHVLKQKERFTWPFYKKKAFSRQANNKCKGKFFIQYTRLDNCQTKLAILISIDISIDQSG